MIKKQIYDNGLSRLVAFYDGELIYLDQYFEEEQIGKIVVYDYEFDEIVKFIEGRKRNE